jgi:RNA polymerase sigma-70 factor, ECF subfamily
MKGLGIFLGFGESLAAYWSGAIAISHIATAQIRDESAYAPTESHSRSQADVTQPPSPGREEIERFRRIMIPQLDAAFSLARYLVRNPADAEDCVQDAYVRALRGFSSYRGGDPKSWLLAIVRNCCMTAVASASLKQQRMLDGVDLESVDSADAAIENHDQADTLQRLINALPTPLREVLVLREIDELSYREIASIIAAPIGTVMSRLARARTQLAKAYRELDTARGNA